MTSSEQNHDQSFMNVFMVVIGILIGITLFLIVVARAIGGDPQLAWKQAEPEYVAAVDQRLAPVGRVVLPGDAPAADAAAAEPAAAPVAAKLTGEQVYNAACLACHGAGVGGAPKFGDAGAWGPRVAQGKATLTQHALQGYQGKAGYMPPKGGRTDLSDQSVINAVDYIVAASQ